MKCWAWDPAASSVTANTSPRAWSMTGVPVMPTRGEMSPQGRFPDGTAVPTCVDHNTAPVLAANSSTVSFSVATTTRPLTTRGSPKICPSSPVDVHAATAGVRLVLVGSAPLPRPSW